MKDVKDTHAELVARLEAELSKLRASHGDALGDLERELAATKATLAQRGEELGVATTALTAERGTTAKLTATLDDLRAAHAEDLNRLEVEQEKALEIAAAQHKKELDDLLASQIEETREMERQFQEAQALLHEQVQLLEERHSELQALYDNRPSREEDLERIKVLEREVEEKAHQLKTMAETLQKFKLELVNREQ